MSNPYRTHTCNDLRATHAGETVRLAGWIHNKRDLGGVLFIDLRDHYGITQIVVPPTADFQDALSHLPKETVISVHGAVRPRPEGTVNPNIATGEIELDVAGYDRLGSCEPLPMNVFPEDHTPEETRLKYRFLDLRRSKLHQTVMLRAKVISSIRQRMINLGFQEFQTPILTSSSPEGARDFLVPSRLYPGEFYALPQAPQQFKQLLMVSGFDRYFQIAPCFRDEDGRADRTPGEFYQLDVEMSFVTQDDVFAAMEKLFVPLFSEFKPDWKINLLPSEATPPRAESSSEFNFDWWKPYVSVTQPAPAQSETPAPVRDFPPPNPQPINRVFHDPVGAGHPQASTVASIQTDAGKFIEEGKKAFVPLLIRSLEPAVILTGNREALKASVTQQVTALLMTVPVGRQLALQLIDEIVATILSQSTGTFERIPYNESMLRFGTDKPDLRIPFTIKDLTPLFANSEFKAFAGKTVRAFAVPQAFDQPRSWFDNLQEEAKKLGAAGLAYVKVDASTSEIAGPIAKFMVAPEVRAALLELVTSCQPNLKVVVDSEAAQEFVKQFKAQLIPYLVQALEDKYFENGNKEALKARIEELVDGRLAADKVPIGRQLRIKLLKDIIEDMVDQPTRAKSVIFFSADHNETKAAKVLGRMREIIAEQLDLIEKNVFKFAWIVDYPMYEMNEETKTIEFSHNPFSMPQGGLDALEKQDPLTIFAYQYDLVCNGYEIASGAIRNHIPEIMYKAFALAGHGKEVVDTEFAGMINAFRYGAPPHGGIAPGIDRIVMLLANESSIREVIAFPMAQNGRDLLMNAPSPVSEKQLRDVHLAIRKPPPKA